MFYVRQIGATIAAVISALLLVELGLRCISSPTLIPVPRIEHDGANSPTRAPPSALD
jgi:hypothetical protein